MAIARNDYFSSVIKRQNSFKVFMYGFFISVASWPRLLLEVFVRRDFGLRYFSFSTAITLAIILAVVPYAVGYSGSYGQQTILDTIGHHITLYIFIGLFIYFCIKRNKEIKKRPNVYSTEYYSLSAGVPNEQMNYSTILGRPFTHYQIVTRLEPLIFFLIGIVLLLIKQYALGGILVVCSIIYRMSWKAQFALSHDYFLDLFDNQICHDELINSLSGKSNRKGFNPNNKATVDEDVARRVFGNSIDDEEVGQVK